jgi:hypothetical protein
MGTLFCNWVGTCVSPCGSPIVGWESCENRVPQSALLVTRSQLSAPADPWVFPGVRLTFCCISPFWKFMDCSFLNLGFSHANMGLGVWFFFWSCFLDCNAAPITGCGMGQLYGEPHSEQWGLDGCVRGGSKKDYPWWSPRVRSGATFQRFLILFGQGSRPDWLSLACRL